MSIEHKTGATPFKHIGYTYDAGDDCGNLNRSSGVQTDDQYDGNDIVAEIEGCAVGVTYLRSLSIDEPFVRQAETNEYFHVDALGTTLDLTDNTGAVTTSYEYEAFGKTTINGTSTNPFQYTGRKNDGTGLYYYRARHYSQGLQRFMSEDPLSCGVVGQFPLQKVIKNPNSNNLYQYVLNSPVNRLCKAPQVRRTFN